MKTSYLERVVSAYIDGEIPVEKREAVERLIETNEEAARLYRDFTMMGDMMRTAPRLALPTDFSSNIVNTIQLRQSARPNTAEHAKKSVVIVRALRGRKWFAASSLCLLVAAVAVCSYWSFSASQASRGRNVAQAVKPVPAQSVATQSVATQSVPAQSISAPVEPQVARPAPTLTAPAPLAVTADKRAKVAQETNRTVREPKNRPGLPLPETTLASLLVVVCEPCAPDSGFLAGLTAVARNIALGSEERNVVIKEEGDLCVLKHINREQYRVLDDWLRSEEAKSKATVRIPEVLATWRDRGTMWTMAANPATGRTEKTFALPETLDVRVVIRAGK